MVDDQFIQLKKVTKIFGDNKVLDEIDLSIPEGKITGIVGASGEGKSTILKLITSFYGVTSGEILYFRRDINTDMSNIKKEFGMAIEDGSYYEDLTVYENLFHFGRLFGINKKILKRRIEGIVYFIGLDGSKGVLAKNLSLGMRKRLDLACALVHKPSVLVLDEPTADLDPLLRNQMLKLIKKINSHGTTIIVTTQILEELDALCDNVAILYNERIVEDGSLKSILKKYKTKTMNDVFTQIFSKKGRKTYQESNEKKTEFDAEKHEHSLRPETLDNNDFIQELKAKENPDERDPDLRVKDYETKVKEDDLRVKAQKAKEQEQRLKEQKIKAQKEKEMTSPKVEEREMTADDLAQRAKERELKIKEMEQKAKEQELKAKERELKIEEMEKENEL